VETLAPIEIAHSGALRETARPTNPSAFKKIRKWAGPDCAREELESRMNQNQKSTREQIKREPKLQIFAQQNPTRNKM
jgi:hypothetical protein